MKALMGKLGKKFLSNNHDRKLLRNFCANGKEVEVVTASNGKRYIISTYPMNEKEQKKIFKK